MASRASMYVTRRVHADSPPSPNATIPAITTEIRVFYPLGTDKSKITDELDLAYQEARSKIKENSGR